MRQSGATGLIEMGARMSATDEYLANNARYTAEFSATGKLNEVG